MSWWGRRTAVVVAGATALVMGLGGCTTGTDHGGAGADPTGGVTTATAGRSTGAPATPRPSAVSASASPRAAATGPAATALAGLPVKGRAPRTGYQRSQFGDGWVDTDHNGCDTRNDILRRDATDITLKPGTRGCVVASGTLQDRYTGTSYAFVRGDGTVQIDHVVALSDAWQKGAQAWSTEQRTAFANDPLNLVATGTATNQQKGDGDAATWLPPYRGGRCAYVARQIAVKATYGLWVTAAERDAMQRVLASCPGEPLPGGADRPAVTP